ncbi:hypothetical protein HMPREF1548_03701 [Clostridium sp. KLE 1755]|nr:hypothetical protein HMPREF1548_03701 [Clostridium sp. KLE 1755]
MDALRFLFGKKIKNCLNLYDCVINFWKFTFCQGKFLHRS